MVQTLQQNTATQDVYELIAAAGPLAAADIAGGLSRSIRETYQTIRFLVDMGDLREDEFGRFQMSGGRADYTF